MMSWGSWCLLGVAVLAGCSDDPPTTHIDDVGGMGGTGGSGGNDWSCLGSLPAQTFEAGSAVGHLRIVELTDDSPLPGVTVRVCTRADEDCSPPLDEGVTDARGAVTLAVTKAEQRFIEVEGPGTITALSFNNGPPKSDPFDEMIRVVSPDTFMALQSLLATTADPARGHAGVQANDCQGNEAVGVVFEVDSADDATVTGYFSEAGIPNTALAETTADGRAAIANLPAGPAILTARIAASGQIIGTRGFFVRAGVIHYPACVEPDPEAE